MNWLRKNLKWILIGFAGILVCFSLYQNSRLFRGIVSNLFLKNKVDLRETVLHVKAENAISNWISTEYYGEVIYSLQEYQENVKSKVSGKILRYDKISELGDFYAWKDSAEKFYQGLHRFLGDKKEKDLKEIPNSYEFYDRDLFDDFESILGKKEQHKTLKFIAKHNINSNRYRKKMGKTISKKESKLIGKPNQDLIMMGRGWVKAGYNLKDISEDNLKVQQIEDTLFIEGFPEAEIITSTINPWFIPDKLLGYEVIFSNKPKDLTFKEIRAVKLGCVRKLEVNALQAGILEDARSSAEKSLLTMVNLMGNEEIVKVTIGKQISLK